jgi:hypothetical protein
MRDSRVKTQREVFTPSARSTRRLRPLQKCGDATRKKFPAKALFLVFTPGFLH